MFAAVGPVQNQNIGTPLGDRDLALTGVAGFFVHTTHARGDGDIARLCKHAVRTHMDGIARNSCGTALGRRNSLPRNEKIQKPRSTGGQWTRVHPHPHPSPSHPVPPRICNGSAPPPSRAWDGMGGGGSPVGHRHGQKIEELKKELAPMPTHIHSTGTQAENGKLSSTSTCAGTRGQGRVSRDCTRRVIRLSVKKKDRIDCPDSSPMTAGCLCVFNRGGRLRKAGCRRRMEHSRCRFVVK